MEEGNLIGQYLVSKGIINEKQLKEALDEQARLNHFKIGEILVRRGLAKEEDIAQALSEQLGFAYVDISTYQIEPEAISLIPAHLASKVVAVPLFKVGNALTVAMANPLDMNVVDELSKAAGGMRIRPIVSTGSAIKDAINRYYGKEAARATATQGKATFRDEGDATVLIKEATQAPVVKLVNQLIEDAVGLNASDIHIEPQEETLYYRHRIDGVLHDPVELPKKLQLAIVSRIKIMSGMDIAQSRLPQDGRIEMKVLGRDIDMRVATFPTIYGEHAAIRILDKSRGILKLEELGFQEDTLKKFREVIRKPYGIVLVTGPTGSGKTTTLYSVLNTINDKKKNIITVEDPVEYTIPNIHQSQVNVRAGLTFATGLRSIVRLDPDIMMIGEIRDKETADIAVHASLTGHLVFSTLHTNDASSAATRLIDISVEPYLVSSSLAAVLAQRLVRKLCPRCRKPYKPKKEDLSIFGVFAKVISGASHIYEPGGCEACQNTGYRGRTGIFELLVPNETIRGLISRKAPAYEIKEEAIKSGMKTLREDGLEKVSQGITGLSEVIRVTEEV